MLLRFSLYGFLKNQLYFEPFIILAFLEKGLTFWTIGLLIGFREICSALLEIPSGAMADLYGRRRSMIFSFCAYIISFVLFAWSKNIWLLAAAMLAFGAGNAFRTGTHKAMIFEWLRLQDRLDERVKIYGQTRSWSKMGSAVSALLAMAFVFFSGSYSSVFWFCIIPYVLGIINFLGYPKNLDGEPAKNTNIASAIHLSVEALKTSFTKKSLRRLLAESMALEGVYKVAKDYLQPIGEALALSLPWFAVITWNGQSIGETRRAAIVIGIISAVNYLLMARASKLSHRAVKSAGGEEPFAKRLWMFNLIIYAAMAASILSEQAVLAVICFIAAGLSQNLFRPAQISRIDGCSQARMGATILSVESQAKSISAAVIAPVLGLIIDKLTMDQAGSIQPFWPVAMVGVFASVIFVLRGAQKDS